MVNEDNELQVQTTICLKNFIRVASSTVKKKYVMLLFSGFVSEILRAINKLLEIPKEKSF